MKKLFIYHADNDIMDNLPEGIEILIIYRSRGYKEVKIFSNLPITLKYIYVPRKMYFNQDVVFPKLPLGCQVKWLELQHEKCYKNDDNFEKELVYRAEKDDDLLLFKYPVMGYSKNLEKYVPVVFKKEYDAPEYKYVVTYEFLFQRDIA